MKKILLAVVFMIAATVAINAQPRAVGARLGYGLQASYEHSLSEKNMIEIEFGFPGFYGVDAAATYDWIFPITNWEHAGSWNWYAGVGAAAATAGAGGVAGSVTVMVVRLSMSETSMWIWPCCASVSSLAE